ncbi:hypothetical protein NLI96_g2264 [Meripilus lineatus]|uniref:Uncharacterized protein n=1 Tax=Meripilus lineatus TaxID=2056292 RepID=A0AAD5VEE0_9APHY|nr:hypothetical protein NLI96_g2264 [Physisporinus lineatus]
MSLASRSSCTALLVTKSRLMDSGQTYGKNLPDQVDRLSSLSDAQLELTADVRDLFRERAALEREYATKLQLLAKKSADKMNKKIPATVVGSEPTKAWNDDSIKRSTLDNSISQLISSLVDSAQDHVNLSDSLNTQVVEALKSTEKRHDEAKKRQMQHFQKLLAERDKTYADRLKYDEDCLEVESSRVKQERSADDRHADRAAKQYEQQQTDMQNSKNSYIIATAIANSAKAKFFNDDLPDVEDQFQDLQTQLLTSLSKIIVTSQQLQGNHLVSLKTRVAATEKAFEDIDPIKDQDLFIDHNIRPFTAPADWVFEPCSTHYDTSDMSVEPAPKVYLQNRLTRCKQKLQELRPIVETRQKEVEKLARLVATYSRDPSLGKVDEISDSFLEAHHQLTFYTISQCVLKTEIETISEALAGDEGGKSPHTFKSTSFSIPTQCAYCKTTIWGLSKQGKTCKSCGISVHNKCELKVPADCGDPSPTPSSSSNVRSAPAMDRKNSRRTSTSSTGTATTPTASSFTRPDLKSQEEEYPSARVIFEFTPTSPFELAISEGWTVKVVEPDDGSGWVKVADESGGKGLVPASYIEIEKKSPKAKPRPPPPRGAARKSSSKFVRALYEYSPQGTDEIEIREGEMIELTTGPTGGQNYADGWWEGINEKGKKGIFPSNYVEVVS